MHALNEIVFLFFFSTNLLIIKTVNLWLNQKWDKSGPSSLLIKYSTFDILTQFRIGSGNN